LRATIYCYYVKFTDYCSMGMAEYGAVD